MVKARTLGGRLILAVLIFVVWLGYAKFVSTFSSMVIWTVGGILTILGLLALAAVCAAASLFLLIIIWNL